MLVSVLDAYQLKAGCSYESTSPESQRSLAANPDSSLHICDKPAQHASQGGSALGCKGLRTLGSHIHR